MDSCATYTAQTEVVPPIVGYADIKSLSKAKRSLLITSISDERCNEVRWPGISQNDQLPNLSLGLEGWNWPWESGLAGVVNKLIHFFVL